MFSSLINQASFLVKSAAIFCHLASPEVAPTISIAADLETTESATPAPAHDLATTPQAPAYGLTTNSPAQVSDLITTPTQALYKNAPLNYEATGKKFVIMTASYNNINYYLWNLDSIFNQTYQNWHLVYIDDMSTDGTSKKVPAYIRQRGFEHKVTFVSNAEKCYCLKNYYREIHKIPNDHIIVCLDGDDAFLDNGVLEYLNKVYANPDIWCTYGNYRYFPKPPAIPARQAMPYPKKVIKNNAFRDHTWCVRALRTFYAGLFKNIDVRQFMYEGSFINAVEDMAYMFPILEQCGKHHLYIDKELYLYNVGTPLLTANTWKNEKIAALSKHIRRQTKYKPLKHRS